MKKLLTLLTSAICLLSAMPATAAENVEIYIDGKMLYCEAAPVNVDGRVLVPMRAIFEALGASVSWDGEGQTVWASRDGEFICVPVGNEILSTGVHNSDGEAIWVDQIRLDVPAAIINDYTYVPVRAISETLGANVSWDGENNRVVIDSRKDEIGTVYYASDSDFQKLYSVGKNGLGRRKLTETRAYDIEMHDGYVYYLEIGTDLLYRVNNAEGESLVIDRSINKLAIEGGSVYYQELDGDRESGVLYRYDIASGQIFRLTDNSVRYPRKYRDYIYFNLNDDNNLYAVNTEGTTVHIMDMGDFDEKLYPFNCVFFGDYILVEDGAWYGNLMRMNLDGTDLRTFTQSNALICEKQIPSDKIVYVSPDAGQDLYCINIDGSDKHLIHESDPSWIDLQLLAQWEDIVYYKNPMRGEVYRVNLDGSEDEYVCYGDDVKVFDGRLFASFEGLYTGSLDGFDLEQIYGRDVKDFTVIDDKVYLIDKKSSKLHMTDFYGASCALTADSVGEWVCD